MTHTPPGKTHADVHPNDLEAEPGFVNVRVDGGGPKAPPQERIYVTVMAGYGEGSRVRRARSLYKEKHGDGPFALARHQQAILTRQAVLDRA